MATRKTTRRTPAKRTGGNAGREVGIQPKPAGGGSRPGPTNGQRVKIDLPNGGQSNVTERLRAKAGFTKVDPKKGPSGRYLGGAKGTKSIVLHFDSASSDLRGRKDPRRAGKASMAMPVNGGAKIDDYIQIANQARASAFTTPNGVTYPVGGGGGRATTGGNGRATSGNGRTNGRGPNLRKTTTTRKRR